MGSDRHTCYIHVRLLCGQNVRHVCHHSPDCFDKNLPARRKNLLGYPPPGFPKRGTDRIQQISRTHHRDSRRKLLRKQFLRKLDRLFAVVIVAGNEILDTDRDETGKLVCSGY